MADLCGFTGKILVVDLSAEDISTLDTADYLPDWVGGRGIGAKIHWDMVGPEVKALDPENVLTFMTGGGTGIIDTRVIVQAVSPLTYPTECYGRSTMGSHFGAELKHAGWDGIVVKGKAEHLVYLLIQNGDVRIMDGRDLAQMDTLATQKNLKARYTEKHCISLIGPAGENLVRDAIIQAGDHNACGLGGFGAVMGSKNLKAIVVRGTLDSPAIYDPKTVLELRQKEADILAPFPGVGAAAGSELERAATAGEARAGYAGCFGCGQPCGYAFKWNDGSCIPMGSVKCGEFICGQAELQATGEYIGRNHWRRITQQGLLGLTGQPSYRMVIQDDIKNYYDEPITVLHNGVITEEDLGIPYKYGTPEFTDTFNRALAYRNYSDAMTALGEGQAKFCNEYLGTPEAIYDYQTNAVCEGRHQMVPGFWITLYRSVGLVMRCVSNVGNAEQRSMYHYLFPMYPPFREQAQEIGMSLANWEFDWAAVASRWIEDFKMSMDLVDRCFFNLGGDAMGPNLRLFQNLHTAITGQPFDEEAEQEACDRLFLLERSILARQGHNRDDDRMFESMADYLSEYGVTTEKVAASVDEFYGLRGLDVETGLPKLSEYKRMGLTDVADRLQKEYGIKLPD